MQVMVPALALSGSLIVLVIAVIVKSVLFALFEKRLPRLRATYRMFLGNVLTSFIGLLVAVMIASSPGAWFIGIPVVCFLCWLPSRRLVRTAPLDWLARMSPLALAGVMTGALLASCILFSAGRGAIDAHRLALYWIIKVAAIFLALFASITLSTVWEEWVIWRLSSRPGNLFFASALRANLYVLVIVMAIAAVLILPKRIKSPDFLAKKLSLVVQETALSASRR